MKKGPEISVVMSVYNGEKYLADSVESVLSQEGVDFEFIIIDDGSTDDSINILNACVKKDQRVKIVTQENQGLTLSLIRGCNEAKGEFIARQDADDLSLPGRFRKQVDMLRTKPSLVFVSSWAEVIGPNGEYLHTVQRPADPKEATHNLMYERSGPPAHGTVMFRKESYNAVGGYRPQFYYGQDSDLWLRMAHVGQIGYVPEVLYRYRYWPENISSAHRDLQKQFGVFGQACHRARLEGRSEAELLQAAQELRDQLVNSKKANSGGKRRTASSYYFIASSLEKQGNPEARRYYWKSIQTSPFQMRSWFRLIRHSLRAH